ncbi:MAG TPA: TonB-dependent receptor, partial [Gemmatimonadales bacterium]|nr:TonB-dependent receptor [Gemmatimonadales bacterium]
QPLRSEGARLRVLGLVLGVLASVSVAARAQTQGAIRGTVWLAAGSPAVHAAVSLSGTVLRTTTDTTGRFILGGVPAGHHDVVAALEGRNAGVARVTLRGGDTVTVSITLGGPVELPGITVTAEQVPSAVAVTTSQVATRTDTPLLETPQTVQTVTSRVIEDQQLTTVNEATRYLTGVIAATNYSQFTLRGFDVYDDAIMTNGFRGNLFQYSQQAQLTNVERVEVLKGPASALYSAGAPGGVMNVVTKQPQARAAHALTLGYGRWGQYEGQADLTGPVTSGSKLLYRFVGEYTTTTDSYRDFQYQKNLMLAPSLAYVLNHDGRLTLETAYARESARFAYDRGSFIRQRPDSTFDFADVPLNYSHQSPDDYSTQINASGTLTWDQRLTPRLRVTAMARYIYQSIDMGEHNGDFGTDPMNLDSLPRTFDTWINDWFIVQTSAFATYGFATGGVTHTLLAGTDLSNAGSYLNEYENGQAFTFPDVDHPDYSHDAFGNYPPNNYVQHDERRNRLIGGYIQDQARVGNLRLLAALRYDTYRSTVRPVDSLDFSQVTDTSAAHALLPRFGVVYLIRPSVSVYGSYTQSFLPQYSNSRGSGGPFPPQTGEQYEIGSKAAFAGGRLSATIAAYTIAYKNILAQDPADTTGLRQIPVPGARSRGVEVSLQGNLHRLALVAGYAYNATTLTEASSFGNKGDWYANAPHHVANLWAAYDVVSTPGTLLTLGAGGRVVSERLGDITDQKWFMVPAYTLLDASAVLRFHRYSMTAAGSNLLDQKWFPGGYYSRVLIMVGDPRSVRLAVTRSF